MAEQNSSIVMIRRYLLITLVCLTRQVWQGSQDLRKCRMVMILVIHLSLVEMIELAIHPRTIDQARWKWDSTQAWTVQIFAMVAQALVNHSKMKWLVTQQKLEASNGEYWEVNLITQWTPTTRLKNGTRNWVQKTRICLAHFALPKRIKETCSHYHVISKSTTTTRSGW